MKKHLLFPFVLLAFLVSVHGVENDDVKNLEYTERVKEALLQLFPTNIARRIPNARSGNASRAIGTKCLEHVTLLQGGLTKGSMWALQMIDASSKIPSGILMGNRIDFGMFDECVRIEAVEGSEEIRGRHCMYMVGTLGPMSILEQLSICLPASCGPEDVAEVLKEAIEQIKGIVGQIVDLNVVGLPTCSALDPPEWTAGGIVTLVGFSLLLLFLVVATICDIFARYFGEKFPSADRLKVLRQFSLLANATRVLSTRTSPETLPALQGIRFFSMCWVILGHAHITFYNSVNLADVLKWIPTWSALYVVIAPFSVDTFFTISGLLMSYLFLKEMSTGRSFNVFAYYLHRYLRLTPALAAMILITIFIAPRLGSGPIWEQSASLEEETCRNRWWTMLLYLHNYVNLDNVNCLNHTWYLAVEMQFFWISPLILYPLARKPKLGLAILAAFFVASVVTPVKIGYDKKYSTALVSPTNMMQQLDGNGDIMNDFYFASHVRAAPWLVGIFFGYLIFTQKGKSAKKEIKWIGWLLATVAFLFCVFTMRVFEAEDYVYDEAWESFYTAVARPFWAFGVSWVIYASVRGFGGPVSKFLSFPIFTPLSRISYCIYLVHFQIQFMKMRAARVPSYFNGFNAFDHFLSDLLLAIAVGFMFTLLFESPVLVLEKIIKKRGARAKVNDGKVFEAKEAEKGSDNS